MDCMDGIALGGLGGQVTFIRKEIEMMSFELNFISVIYKNATRV